MNYISTRGTAPRLDFEGAMLAGLAEDGGLYLPVDWPRFSRSEIRAMAGLSYEDLAFRVMRPFTGDTMDDDEFGALVRDAYAGFKREVRAPLVQLGAGEFLLELFHGPTLSFKDFAMQLVGRLFDAVLRRRNQRVTIIGATSGDTGSAAIEAFRGSGLVDVFIFYPHGMVSDVQRRQMTVPGESNVHALAVDGDFDDCQALVKAMFSDSAFRQEMGLAGINSINWARILAQIVYYYASAVALGAPDREVSFTVPTGNFGDVFAGFAARQTGLPIRKLVIATNQNDILNRVFAAGRYAPDVVRPSLSPSMDIQVSSNFERAMFEAHGRNARIICRHMEQLSARGSFEIGPEALSWLREQFACGRCSESETRATMKRVWERAGQAVCPHTAVGLKVASEAIQNRGDTPMITLSTAHPAKFPEAIQQTLGIAPLLPEALARLESSPERLHRIPNELQAAKDAILRGLPA